MNKSKVPSSCRSWGNYPKTEQQEFEALPISLGQLPDAEGRSMLAYGQGRSYGDSCLNDKNALIRTRSLDHFISFDESTGLLKAESGVTLAEILNLAVPKGWFLPVVPGTKYVSLAGAIANDVHGKNHHRAGTFGRHVRSFALLRSSGEQLVCSKETNGELFSATIGGLGLTGLILWAEIQLAPIKSPLIDQEVVRFSRLEEFFELSGESDASFEYTVAWIDSLAAGQQLGRGVFMRGNHAALPVAPNKMVKNSSSGGPKLSVPIFAPNLLLNSYSLKLFNSLYYFRHPHAIRSSTVHHDPFFFPLDSIGNWNRLYGKRGFLQYQCVVPSERNTFVGREVAATEIIREILRRISAAKLGSFLSVLKIFGDQPSPGLLSFPKAGITLALDFPVTGLQSDGTGVFGVLNQLDEIVANSGGRVYPAKDARMSPHNFKRFFPAWEIFAKHIDPQFSSSFWRRVTDG